MMKQKVPQEFWDELLLKLRRYNNAMKALPKPAKSMDERRVTALLAKSKKEDAAIKIDTRKGKYRHAGQPRSEFIKNQMAHDAEKYNSPAYKAIVAERKGIDPDLIASSEEE